MRWERGAVIFDGEARVAFCPCPDPPLSFMVNGGRFEPYGDLVVRFPRVAVGGVPIFALPLLWIRAPDRIALLPPLVAVRGADGLLLGSGVRLPWRTSSGSIAALDLTAGGYVKGGAEIGARLAAPGNTASVTADLIHGTRVALEGRGAIVSEASPSVGAAWMIDAVRGDRGRAGTIDFGAAAQPFDTAAAEVSVHAATTAGSVVFGAGAIARAPRGEGPIAAGPRATLALGGAIAGVGSWSAEAGGVVLGDARTGGATLPIARAAGGVEIDARPGPFELRASAGARARFANEDAIEATSSEAAAAARVDLALPFARAFASSDARDAALVHEIAPSITLRGAVASQRGPFFVPIGGVVPTASWIAAAGVSTALGRAASFAMRLEARAGATGSEEGARSPLLHARFTADAQLAAATVEAAAVGDRLGDRASARPTPDALAPARGLTVIGRVRLGSVLGPSLRLDAAAQEGASAGQARAIASGAWAALPGDDLAYFATAGVTGGAELAIPWTRAVRTSVRLDADLVTPALRAGRALAAYAHPCGCFGLALTGARRVGRDGVDVGVSIDVLPPIRARRE